MVKKVIFCIALFLLVLPMVIALQTTINVKTLPTHDVTITLVKPTSQYYSIVSFPNIYSDWEGIASVNYTGDEQKFHIWVIVKKNNQVILNEQFNNRNAGGVIDLELYPEGYEVPEEEDEDEDSNETIDDSNETSEDDNSLIENQTEENTSAQGITGLATEDENKKSSNWIFYVIGVIILLGIIGLGIVKGMQMRGPPHETKQIRKSYTGEDKSELIHELSDSERKIRYLEKEVKKLKNKDKIDAIERKIEEEQEEVERLKRGEDREESERLKRDEKQEKAERLKRDEKQEKAERLKRDKDREESKKLRRDKEQEEVERLKRGED